MLVAPSAWTTAAFSTLVVLVSGCTDSGPTIASFNDDDELLRGGPLVSDTAGAIVGLVIDDGLNPIANATVSVFNTSKDSAALVNATTDGAGAFQVGQLLPQTYRVTAQAPGFGTSSQLVQVNAAEITRATFTVGAVASNEPYIELFIDSGVTGCGITVVWLVLGGPCFLVFPDLYKTQFPYTIADDWAYLVFESHWQTRDAIWMFVDLDDDGTCLSPGLPCPGSIIGTSPLRVDGAPESGMGTDQYQNGEMPYPPAGQGFPLWVNFSDFGLLYDELNTYATPVCDLNGGCGGIGTSLEIRFDVFTSVFHHEPPPSPEQYTALPDT